MTDTSKRIKGIKVNDMLPKTVNMLIDSKYVIGILRDGNKYRLNTALINRIKELIIRKWN